MFFFHFYTVAATQDFQVSCCYLSWHHSKGLGAFHVMMATSSCNIIPHYAQDKMFTKKMLTMVKSPT